MDPEFADNAAGGVLGKQLELITEDDQSKDGESATAVKKLISRDKVVAILGEVGLPFRGRESGDMIGGRPVSGESMVRAELPGMRGWYDAGLRETFRDEPHDAESRAGGDWLQDLRAR